MNKFDLIVIGSGPAGEKAAAKAAYFGKSVALVEKETGHGGAGVHTGTVPSKTLKETSLYLSGKHERGLYGIERSLPGQATAEHFLYRKNVVTRALDDEVRRNLELHQVALFRGTASFVDAHRVRVAGAEETVLQGDYILIATGSYPFHPPGIAFDGVCLHDSDSILRIQRIPSSICVVGAGVIGCEYATIFAALGSRVSLINSHRDILQFLDREIAGELVRQMQADGIELFFETRVESVEKFKVADGDRIRAGLDGGRTLEADIFLYAAGRCGNIASLDCPKAGVATGPRETVLVNEDYQTCVPHIYAVGDVIGFPALASTSMDQGRVAVAHMFQIPDLKRLAARFPFGIYTIPEVSMFGMTEETARGEGVRYCIGKARYADMVRGKIMGVEAGFLKLVFRRSDNVILGVHVIGPIATELVHYGMTLVEEGRTLDHLIATVFNFPTLHDLYKYAAYDGLGNKAGHKIRT